MRNQHEDRHRWKEGGQRSLQKETHSLFFFVPCVSSMEDSDEDPSSIPHRPPPPRPSKLALIDASSLHPSIGLYSDPHTSSQSWYVSQPLASGRSSRASTDNEELESVRKVLRQRRLSRQSMLINHVSPEDNYAGIKVGLLCLLTAAPDSHNSKCHILSMLITFDLCMLIPFDLESEKKSGVSFGTKDARRGKPSGNKREVS